MLWFRGLLRLLITLVIYHLVPVQHSLSCLNGAGQSKAMYIPFQGHKAAQVWTPYKDPRPYHEYRDRYRKYSPSGAGRASADKSAKDILHALALASSMQTGSYIPPLEVWHPIIKRSAPAKGRAVSAGIILDYLFVSVSKPSPS